MLRIEDALISLETAHTGYYIAPHDGLAEQLHYGARLHANPEALREKAAAGYGSSVVYQSQTAPLSLEQIALELSPQQKGDFRASALTVRLPNGSATADLRFAAARRVEGGVPPEGLPGAFGGEATLCMDFTSPDGLLVTLLYTVYPDCDVITRRMAVRNCAREPVTLSRCMSYQLDLPRTDYTLSTFTGAWARERHETRLPLVEGAHTFGSTSGVSGAFCNPFFMLAEPGATEETGRVYGFNLIYSGSYAACVEASPFGHTRVLAGIQPEGFAWTLAPGETFETPEAVLAFSAQGKNGMSAAMHDFVNRHVVRGRWAGADRPVLANNWEATYFNFTESKLLRIARAAAKAGVELFVLDDGWFGARNADNAGLGDYNVNYKKLPEGLAGLAEKINGLGMKFGLWFEPEMVNANSDLYRAHPDWIVATPGVTPSESRNQFVLDLCRTEVQDYIIENVNRTLAGAQIEYVKWDMNRPLTDLYSSALTEQGRFSHCYVLGLYRVMRAIVEANPEVLFEGCASGGNRFDLGILSFMPQIWASDNTDAYERMLVQAGTSYGYPQSVMGCHVSAVPNHQTLRVSPIESRFDVAAFGCLGYELDFTELTPAETKVVKAQIAYYKAHRRLFQYGRFRRLLNPCFDGSCAWLVASEDGAEAVAGEFMQLMVPNSRTQPLRLAGLQGERCYQIEVRPHAINIKTAGSLLNFVLPVKVNTEGLLVHTAAQVYMLPCERERYTVYGDLLMEAGLRCKQRFTGTGYNENVRMMPDFGTRMFYLCADAAAAPEAQAASKQEKERWNETPEPAQKPEAAVDAPEAAREEEV